MSAKMEDGQNSNDAKRTQKVPLLWCKVTWFFFGSIGIIYLSFQYPFLTSIGLKPWDVGVISAVSTIVAAPIAPCWGALSDRTGYRRSIIIFLCVAFMAIMASVPWIGGSMSYTRSNCTLVPQRGNKRDLWNNSVHTQEPEHSGSCQTPSHLFWSMLVLWLCASSCLLPLYGFFQSVTMNLVEHTDTSQGCGDQMMFMPIGGGVISLLAGVLADKFHHPVLTGYEVVYLLVPLLALPLVPSTFVLFKYTHWNKSEETKNDEKRNISKDVSEDGHTIRVMIFKKIFSNTDTLLLLLTVLIIGVLMSFNNSFLFLLMKDEMKASKTSMGLAALVQCLSGTCMYYFIERMVLMLNGVVPCIEISVLSYVVRFVVTSYIRSPWLMALPMMLSGFGESLSTAAMMKYMHEISPVEVHSTMFTLMSCLTFALGPCLSHLVGSWFYQTYKGPTLYRGASLVGVVWLFVLLLSFHVSPRIMRRYLATP